MLILPNERQVVQPKIGWFKMTPRQFFREVAEPNAKQAITARSDLRLAINAIMTLDALFGILHATLHEASIVRTPRDDDWKEELAKQSADYRLLRDAAYALKHGHLNVGKKQRIVRRPEQLFTMPGAFQANAFSSTAFDTGQVWIETAATDHRAHEVIEKVVEFAILQLGSYGM
ncbi:hypothetical protein UNPA324_10555 [Bradyrhizobium sp. UNPA324]|nr:hypothetical protein UNPA324_10555 [Bradyrhizobium sp. UNPA324]